MRSASGYVTGSDPGIARWSTSTQRRKLADHLGKPLQFAKLVDHHSGYVTALLPE
jgi:hypothetical protein